MMNNGVYIVGVDLGIIEIVHWVTLIFPSLSQYTSIIVPVLVFTLSVIGIFSNILPSPGNTYPVPEKEDLYTELHAHSRFIYRMALITRQITLWVNRIICSKPYKWFYVTTEFCSILVNRLRGKRLKSSAMGITKPKPYQINLERLKDFRSRRNKKD